MPADVDALVRWLGSQDCQLEPGLSDEELARAEEHFELIFSPLWRAVLSRVHPVDIDGSSRRAGYPDWRSRNQLAVRTLVERPVEGLLFDVADNDFWWTSWGARPADVGSRLRAARTALVTAPRLVPLRGHWYVGPSDDSPVFSIVQTDLHIPAVTLGDLPDGRSQEAVPAEDWPIGDVAFWSRLHAYSQRPDDPRFAGLATHE
ncbi:MAG: hypothetical protein ACR2LX_06860 [Jatrophihabitans sp.]